MLASFSRMITMVNMTITTCLFALVGIQIFIWGIKLRKDSFFFIQLQMNPLLCLWIPLLIAFIQSFCVFERRVIKKQLQIVRWWQWIGFIFISFSFGILLYILSTTEIVQTWFEFIFDVSISHFICNHFFSSFFQQKIPSLVNQNSTSIEKNSFLPKRNLIDYLECSSIICSIHQIILLIFLIRWKPKNFDWFKYQDEPIPPSLADDLKNNVSI